MLSRPLAIIALVSLTVLPLASSWGCSGTVTEEDLQKWTNNDIGLERIAEVVADPEQPLATRIRALEVVVEKGLPTRIRAMVDNVKDARGQVVEGLTRELLDHVKKGSASAWYAKDALLVIQRYVPKDRFVEVQEAIAGWAFADVSWESTAQQVKVVGSRISHGQISDLGKFGWEGAAVLVSHGFVVDAMLEYLARTPSDHTAALTLKGLKANHDVLGPQVHHLEFLSRAGTPEGADYLLQLYLDKEQPLDIRTAAYNWAVPMLGQDSLKKSPRASVVGDRLLAMMDPKRKNATDRWLGAVNLIQFEGVGRLGEILKRFPDDKTYGSADEDAAKSVMDFCLDIHDLGYAKVAIPVFLKHLQTKNRIVQAIGIVCLKANRAHRARPALAMLAQFDGKEEDVSIDDFLGEELTLGRLANNAVQGLDMIKALQSEHKAGKLTKEQFRQKSLYTVFDLALIGEPYPKVIDARFQQWLVEYEAEKRKKQKEKEASGAEKAGADKPKAGADKGGAAPAAPRP